MKSVLGEFRPGVSICPNKGPQSDLGAPCHQGRPIRGTWPFPPVLSTLGILPGGNCRVAIILGARCGRGSCPSGCIPRTVLSSVLFT